MSYLIYTGDHQDRPGVPRDLPRSLQHDLAQPEGYIPDEGLVYAANTALWLSWPLLLTGDPGCGKTTFAASLASGLGLERPLEFRAKTASTSRDLLYSYDALARFQARRAEGRAQEALPYITLNALGLSILLASDPEILPDELRARWGHTSPRRSVVLIDEIDKAPRDLPNDLLTEIERMSYSIPEIGVLLEALPEFHPVLVVTSNSEKHLPDAFLRRCVYYDIPFPDDRLEEIVDSRLADVIDIQPHDVKHGLHLFRELRRPGLGLRKPPATAELLGWLQALSHATADSGIFDDPSRTEAVTLSALIKSREDAVIAGPRIKAWVRSE